MAKIYEWKIESITAANNDPIGSWTDGIASLAATSTGTARPLYKTAITPSGKAVLRFDGADDKLISSGSVVSAKHLFMVAAYRPTTTTNQHSLFALGSGGYFWTTGTYPTFEYIGAFSATAKRDGIVSSSYYGGGQFAVYDIYVPGGGAGSPAMFATDRDLGSSSQGAWDICYLAAYDAQVTGSAYTTIVDTLTATYITAPVLTPPTITTTTLPDGIIDTSYSETLAAVDGTGAITWSVTGGALPAGLTLNASTGEISGTPTALGTASFTVTATDTVAATDTQALSIAITEVPSPFDPYDLLQVTPGLRIESIAWAGPVLRASFGSGYGAKALVGNASGLHRWSIHSGGIWWDALDSMTIGGVSRFEYYWEFFKAHTTGDQEIFVIQWRDRYWHAEFADVEMSVEKFKNALIYQGGFEVIQRRVQGAAYNTDGSINLMTTDLIAYWKLDEVSGNAIDAHGSNDLTDTNTVGTAAGKVGNARDFEQSNNEYFTLADNADLSIADHGWTWTAWVYAESLIAYQAILSKSDDTAVEYILYHLGGVFVLNASPDGTPEEAASVASGAVTTGTWYFVAAWYDASANTINIQINNGTIASAAMATGGVNSAVAFELGHESNLGISWDGLIDEVAFWKRALSASERTFLYNSGDGVTYEDLV